MNLVKVEGHAGLARDKNTGAILNINSNEIDRIKEMGCTNQKQRKMPTVSTAVSPFFSK